MNTSNNPGLRRYHHRDFEAHTLAGAKDGAVVSVSLPARDEEVTVGRVVAVGRTELVERAHLIDEIVVADDLSTNATATVAARAGAIDVPSQCPLSEGDGRGATMATALAVRNGDMVVFLDADVVNFAAHLVVGVVAPLLSEPTVSFVKATSVAPSAREAGDTKLAAWPPARGPLSGAGAVRPAPGRGVRRSPGGNRAPLAGGRLLGRRRLAGVVTVSDAGPHCGEPGVCWADWRPHPPR